MEVQPLTLPTLLRLTARLTSLVSIGLLLLFVGGHDGVFQTRPTSQEMIGLMFFPLGVGIGLVLAWWREALGASIALASLAAFYIVYGAVLSGRLPGGPWFIVFTSPAALFLASWAIRTRTGRAASIEAR